MCDEKLSVSLSFVLNRENTRKRIFVCAEVFCPVSFILRVAKRCGTIMAIHSVVCREKGEEKEEEEKEDFVQFGRI